MHVSNLTNVAQFEAGAPADGDKIHEVVNMFALVIAEAARFDEVLAGVARAGGGGALEFKYYWPMRSSMTTRPSCRGC